MNEPLISVVIPVYGNANYKQYMQQCIESVMNQTYRNLEILVVDDGSPEDAARICDRYAQQDSRVKVFHKPHTGVAETRNLALDHARGEYLAFVDGDDWIEPNTYENMMAFLQSHPEVDAVLCAARRYPENGEGMVFTYYPSGTIIDGSEMLRRMLLDEIGGQAPLGLYRKFLWDGVRFPGGMLFEDIPTTYKAFLHARKVGFLREPYYVYRVNQLSISKNPAPIKSYNIFQGYEDHFFSALKYCPEAADVCCTKAAHFAVSTYFHYCCEGCEELAPTVDHIRSHLDQHKETIRRHWDVLPGSRKLALQIYYCSPVLFRIFCRLLHLTGLQKRMGLDVK